MGWDGMEWDGMGWEGKGRDGMGWDGMDAIGWDGMGWNEVGWNGMEWGAVRPDETRRDDIPMPAAHFSSRLTARLLVQLRSAAVDARLCECTATAVVCRTSHEADFSIAWPVVDG